ncbi:MAG: DUF21 domain-containing protein [Alphaproteobacteria bacterium]|nr:MAG: DUF21 domain-containing protein [Alphaproteobacteria bacterium]
MVLVLVFFLLLLAALLASCETSLNVASKSKIHKLVKEGNKSAVVVKELQDNAGEVISAILTSVSIATMLIPFLTAIWAVAHFGDLGQAIVGVVVSIVFLIYGETVPKMIALSSPETVLLKSARFLRLLTRICKIPNILMRFIADATLKMLRVKHSDSLDPYEEIRTYIDLQMQQISEEKSMLNSILDLSKVEVQDIMTFRKNVQMLNADDTLENIINTIKTTPYTRLPIWKEQPDNIVGVVHAKAFLEFFIKKGKSAKNFDVLELAKAPWFVPETTNLLDQLKAFRTKNAHFAVIVDEFGVFQGIVTLEDLIEEIVGEIHDEYDIKLGHVMVRKDGSILLPGDFTIRDLNRQFNFELEDTEATIAGLLLHVAQKIPEVGRVYDVQGVRFEVMKRNKNYISLVKVSSQ